MGDGDAALATVRGAAAGVLDIPWSPNKHVPGAASCPPAMPTAISASSIPATCRSRATSSRCTKPDCGGAPSARAFQFGHDLAVSSVYEISETLEKLAP